MQPSQTVTIRPSISPTPARLTRRAVGRVLAGAALGSVVALAGCVAPAVSAPPVAAQRRPFPAFVYASPTSLEAYQQATRLTDLFAVIPCYCGCKTAGHRNLKECFIKPDTSYEPHAAGCDTCIQEALLAARLHQEGQSFKAIRTTIDARFAASGPPTDTPLP